MTAILIQRVANGYIAVPAEPITSIDLSKAQVFPDDLDPYSAATTRFLKAMTAVLNPPAPAVPPAAPSVAAALTEVRDLLGDVPAEPPAPEPESLP